MSKRNYKLEACDGTFIIEHRNAKKSLIDHGGEKAAIYTLSGKKISEARRDGDGNIYNCIVDQL